MKNSYIFLFMIILALPLVVSSCNKSEDIKLDFDITFPEDWVYYVYANEGYILEANRSAVDESDTLREALVIYKTLDQGGTLDLYFATLKLQILQSPAYDSLLYDTDTLINEERYKKMLSIERLMYINKQPQDTTYLDAITTRYFFRHNDYGYNFTFIALDSAYTRTRPIFDNIIGSVRFKN